MKSFISLSLFFGGIITVADGLYQIHLSLMFIWLGTWGIILGVGLNSND